MPRSAQTSRIRWRTAVVNQLTEDAGCRRGGENFLYVFKAALNGPHAPPPGRASDAPLSLHAGHATHPAAGAESGKPGGRRTWKRRNWLWFVGRQPAGARRPPHRRAVGRVTAGRGGDAARRMRGRPSGLKGASHRCATALRAALDPGASATPRAGAAGRRGPALGTRATSPPRPRRQRLRHARTSRQVELDAAWDAEAKRRRQIGKWSGISGIDPPPEGSTIGRWPALISNSSTPKPKNPLLRRSNE